MNLLQAANHLTLVGCAVAFTTSKNAKTRARGIRSHIIFVGKMNPAKLAYIAEINCFVIFGCPENDFFTLGTFSNGSCPLSSANWPSTRPGRANGYSTDFAEILQ